MKYYDFEPEPTLSPITTYALAAAIALFGAIVVIGIRDARRECDDKGGRLVRGVVWYECVTAVPE